MELLRELMKLQEERGFLDHEVLRQLAKAKCVPLYRLEELVSFYPVFRRAPPAKTTVHVCRDVTCAMSGCTRQTAVIQKWRFIPVQTFTTVVEQGKTGFNLENSDSIATYVGLPAFT